MIYKDGYTHIYIVDDDDQARLSLHSLLSLSFEAHIHGFRTGDDFLDVQRELEPGCLLLDLHMPGTSGLDVLSMIVKGGRFATIILTGNGDIHTAITALKAGAFDFIEKPYEFDLINNAISDAFQRLEQGIKARERADVAKSKIQQLSVREFDVLRGLIDGRSNKMIALDLQISPRTVEVYRANMMDKLHVGNLSDALRIAYSAGMLEEADS